MTLMANLSRLADRIKGTKGDVPTVREHLSSLNVEKQVRYVEEDPFMGRSSDSDDL